MLLYKKQLMKLWLKMPKKKLNGQEDVLIIIAGAPHIYGLNKELGLTFDGSVKLVVGNFEKFTLDPSNLESIENAKMKSGKKLRFQKWLMMRF